MNSSSLPVRTSFAKGRALRRWLILPLGIAALGLCAVPAHADVAPTPSPVPASDAPQSDAVAASPAAASAAATEDKGELAGARAHFNKGVAFYNNGDYKLSQLEFRRSYELSRNYRILYNIGQVDQQLNNYARALIALEEYLRQGGSDVPAERRAEVMRSIAELKKKTAVLSFELNLADAEIFVDAEPIGKVSRDRALIVDAGDHSIEARRNGYQPARTRVTVAAGDSTRVKLALLRAIVLSAPVRETPPEPKNRTLIWGGWIATGALAVGAGITGALATSSASDLATLRNSPTSTEAEREAAGKQARSFAIASDALTAGAVVIGAASLYFTLSSSSHKTERRPAPITRLAVSPKGVSLIRKF